MSTDLEHDKLSEDPERRIIKRWLRSEAVSVQLMQAYCEDTCATQVIRTQTLDVSVRGLRLIAEEAIGEGYLFDICVELRDHPQRFLLTGETRWCRHRAQHEDYEIGIEIHDGEGTDYLAWTQTILAAQDDGYRPE